MRLAHLDALVFTTHHAYVIEKNLVVEFNGMLTERSFSV